MQFGRFMAGRVVAATLALGLCGAAVPAAATAVKSARLRDSRGWSQSHNDPLAHKHSSATLEACIDASPQAGGAATFAAQMTAMPGAYKLEMRFEVLERQTGQPFFHRPSGAGAPGLGAWRVSGPHVTILKDYDEVTNLTGPALYKAKVRFRWLDAEGHPIHWTERETEPCRQPPAAQGVG